MGRLFSSPTTELSMAGKIRTKERCPRCGGKFQGEPLWCPDCKTHPRRYFLDLFWKGSRYKLYKDKDERPLTSWEHVVWLSQTIDTEIKRKSFNPKDYLPENRSQFLFAKQMEKWLDRKKEKGRSPTYTEKLTYYKDAFYLKFFDGRDVRDITTDDIDNFHDFLLAQRPQRNRGKATLSPKTRKNIMDGLRQFFNDCCRRDIIVRVPAFEEIPVPEYDWQWIDEATQDAIIENIPEKHRPVFLFLSRHATRPGEAMALDWPDIDFERQIVRIAKNWIYSRESKGYNIKETTKEENIRYIPIDGECFEWMLKNRGIAGPVFRHAKNGRYTHRTLDYWWRKGLQGAGLTRHIPLKDGTRHSVASQALNRGVDLSVIGDFLGHKDFRTTRARYAHRRIDTLRAVLSPNRPQRKIEPHKPLKIQNKKS